MNVEIYEWAGQVGPVVTVSRRAGVGIVAIVHSYLKVIFFL